jgi:hypothetical protein
MFFPTVNDSLVFSDATSESMISSLRDEKLSQQESIALAASQHASLRTQHADAIAALTQSHKQREQELLASKAGMEKGLLAKQTEMDKLIDTYMLTTAMQLRVRSNGWVACKMVNRSAGREISFEMDVDTAEEEIEFKPIHIHMNGISFPSWMMEGFDYTHTLSLSQL